jgi:hypothetical protein
MSPQKAKEERHSLDHTVIGQSMKRRGVERDALFL